MPVQKKEFTGFTEKRKFKPAQSRAQSLHPPLNEMQDGPLQKTNHAGNEAYFAER